MKGRQYRCPSLYQFYTFYAMANYINNAELRTEILLCKDRGQLSDKGCLMLVLMIDNIQSKFKYDRLEDKEDVRSFAIEGILKKWHKYDSKHDNAFSFFTQMIKNDLYAGWNALAGKRADVSISNIFIESV